ncbi:MAG: SGNH/GDSL hydrolase family protein [Lachnospiraceae bacterium]|nr:SGNH/GDSL hydrolase family protein [Lachnospiraceae bacterium]
MFGAKLFLLTACVTAVLAGRGGQYQQKEEDLNQLLYSEYSGVFCSMYSVENYDQEDFASYYGVDTLKIDTELCNTAEMGHYVYAALASGNSVGNVFLGLDLEQLWNGAQGDLKQLEADFREDILSLIPSRSGTRFHVLFSAPSLNYWLAKSEQEIEELMAVGNLVVSMLDKYHNVDIYFFGDQEWLTANPENYVDDHLINKDVTRKLFLYTICDGRYKVHKEMAAEQLENLKQFVLRRKKNAAEYPDLFGWDVVLFGDSIIGNHTGSSSVAGVISGLSNARVYSMAVGGTTAAQVSGTRGSFSTAIELFATGDVVRGAGLDNFGRSLEQYILDDHGGRRLCFVINYGLNDYFNGYSVANKDDIYDDTTYAGALRSGVDMLKKMYPDAVIVLMTPNYITVFENGTLQMSQNGGTLVEYLNMVGQVAGGMNVGLLDNYTGLGIHAGNAKGYLEDGCHLNEAGRYLLGIRILEKIGRMAGY